MPEAEYPRGNVQRYPNGATVTIETDAADAIHVGRRGQRSGLLYDESYPGFHPCLWPCVVSPPADGHVGSYRLVLEGGGGGGQVVDVCYDPHADRRLLGWAQTAMELHVPCREGDISVGDMVGVGDHLARDGRLVHYKTQGEASRRRVAGLMQGAGGVFEKHFGGRDVGFHDMLHTQQRLWPQRKSPIGWPLCWDASQDLGNARHRDADGHRSYAWWGRSGQGSSSWWLLFPDWGVAISLEHSTWVSWDGRQKGGQWHCTAVPQIAEGDGLYSIFCSLPLSLLNVRERVVSSVCTMQERAAGEAVSGREVFAQLQKGTKVTFRTEPLAPEDVHARGKGALRRWVKKHTRWALATVVRVTETHVELKDDSSTGARSWLSVSDVSNRVVLRS